MKRQTGAPLAAGEALLPFRPGRDGAWDRASAAHLLRRAAFGAPVQDVERALERGPQQAAEALIAARDAGEGARLVGDNARRLGSLEAVQAWWIYRMLLGTAPAHDKLALFWHGHFATSDEKVDNPRSMMRQVELFLEKGDGPFGDLLLAVARDPAMLIWLDGNENRRGRPNENFARELMELFSLGIGNYTEEDIREAARAFTGWHVRRGEFWFDERLHDGGEKTVFGTKRRLGGEDVVRLCLGSPACAELVARKLYEYYVSPRCDPELGRALGELYESCGKRTGEFLARLWSSRIFYSDAARRSLVAPPVDFVAGSLRTLGLGADARDLAKVMARMGQDLLRPPSVKGWDGGLSWLDSSRLLARYRFAAEAGERWGGSDRGGEDDGAAGDGSAELLARLFPDGLAGSVRSTLLEAAGGDTGLLLAGCLQLPESQFI